MCLEISHERAVGFNDDLVLVAIIDYFSLLVPRVKLSGETDFSVCKVGVEAEGEE